MIRPIRRVRVLSCRDFELHSGADGRAREIVGLTDEFDFRSRVVPGGGIRCGYVPQRISGRDGVCHRLWICASAARRVKRQCQDGGC